MKPVNDLDYVEMYAEALKNDNRLFAQQKELIDSQMQASSSLFRNMFGEDFATEARMYLRKRGVLKPLGAE